MPAHLGPYPVERLRRATAAPAPQSVLEGERRGPVSGSLSGHIFNYYKLFAPLRDGDAAPATAPLPDDAVAVANEIKASGVFLGAAAIGICAIAGTNGTKEPQKAIVLAAEIPRPIESDNLAHACTQNSGGDSARLRAGATAISLGGYIRKFGYIARTHSEFDTEVDLETLAIHAGVCVRKAITLNCHMRKETLRSTRLWGRDSNQPL